MRRLRADPWAAAGAILAAALGAGLNTAVFAVAYGVLLRPFPYAHAERLAIVDADTLFVRVPDWRAGLTSFEPVAAYARDNSTIYGVGDPRIAAVAVVDDDFFTALGTPARLGRAFGRGDAAACVISESLAHEAGEPPERLIGRQIVVGDASMTVVGVMADAFAFPSDQIRVWMPVSAARVIAFDSWHDARRFRLVGRLRAGITFAQAADEATRIGARIDPSPRGDRTRVAVTGLQDALVGAVRPVLLAFTAAGAIVLLVACANIATILIGRTLGRQRDMAVRRALGAGRMDLLVSVLAESVLISTTGGVLGVALALGSVRLLERWAADIIPRLGSVRIDATVLLFAIGCAAVASLMSAAPALTALGAGTLALRTAGAGGAAVNRRLRGGLIVTQIALAVVLLTGGGLLAKTIVRLMRSEIGIRTEGAAVSQLLLTQGTTFDAGSRASVQQEILRRIRALPGVTAAGSGSSLPPLNAMIAMRVSFDRNDRDRTSMLTLASTTPGYLTAIGARMIDGRDFTEDDDRQDRRVAVLSESAARVLMRSGGVIGHDLPVNLPGRLRSGSHATVTGVVGDIKYAGLENAAGPTVYVMWKDLPAGQTFLAVRTSGDPRSLAQSIHAVIRSVDPRMPLTAVRTLDDVIQQSVADRRLRALLGGAVGLLAFAVAMVGLAASLMRIVFERRHELAIRAALGATPARTIRAVMAEGAALAAAGLLLGGFGAIGVGRLLRSMLQGVGPYDPATLASVGAVVGVTALLACYAPARRAARVDPLALLRAE